MRCPSALELVAAWERGVQQPSFERALTLLGAASTESREELAKLSIGVRDARLLELCEIFFGSRFDAFAECPACDERLEYSFSARDLGGYPAVSHSAPEFEAAMGQIRMRLRLPTSEDLSAASRIPDVAVAQRTLAERCVVEALCGEEAIPAQALSEELLDFAASRVADADPAADQQIELSCPACGHSWQVLFDVERFLWAKVNALVKRLLTEVHVLARAYGWTEREVLALGSARRQFYLEMVG
jgi:hypothetical protein